VRQLSGWPNPTLSAQLEGDAEHVRDVDAPAGASLENAQLLQFLAESGVTFI
jgi:hypothetical protein